MKAKTMFLGCLAGVLVLTVCYEATSGKSEGTQGSLKVGTISVRKLFQQSKRIDKYRQKTVAERNKVEAELEALAKEIEAEKAGLKTLKLGSEEYALRMKETMAKQASAQAQQRFYEQQWQMKEQEVIEQLYKDVLHQSKQVAKEKGLDMVFERSEPELPAANANELTLTISTHKLLYSGGCPDITDEVMSRIDSGQ